MAAPKHIKMSRRWWRILAAINQAEELTKAGMTAANLCKHFQRNYDEKVQKSVAARFLKGMAGNGLICESSPAQPEKRFQMTKKGLDALQALANAKEKGVMYSDKYYEPGLRVKKKEPVLSPLSWKPTRVAV